MFDVAIIGCSVTGCYLGNILSRRLNVLAIEEHKKIGFPSKCTGLVSWRIKELVEDFPEKIIQNTIKEAEFFSPSGKSFRVKSKKPFYVIDRPKFDQFLYRKNLGYMNIVTGEKFMKIVRKKDHLEIHTNKNVYKAKVVVGADGAFSQVAKSVGLKQPDKIFYGIQATMDCKCERNKVELWFGSKIAPNFFGWVVPIKDNKAKIGLAVENQANKYFKKFVRTRCKKYVKPDTAGIIRIGIINKSVSDRVLLIGDAASQIKPFSGGGIIYSLISSKIASTAILKAFKVNDFSEKFFMENYEKIWKEKVGKAIKRGLRIRRILYAFGDRWIDFIFSLPVEKIVKDWDPDLL